VLSCINYNSTKDNLAFQMANNALCIRGSATGDVVRPLVEFRSDGTNTTVVINVGNSACGSILSNRVATYAATEG
jgi:hypothetical protein